MASRVAGISIHVIMHGGERSAILVLVSLAVACEPVHGAALAVPAWFQKNMIPPRQAAETMRTLNAQPTLVVVDANNVRGAVNFRLSKLKLTTLIEDWASKNGLSDRVVLCWDHGLVSEALLHNSVCHAWAGSRQSADDLIANNVLPGLYEEAERDARVCVVTTDRELIQRCKRAAFESGASMGRLRLLGTRKFVSLLMHSSPGREEGEGAGSRDGCEIAFAYERGETSVRRFALTLRKRRMHERRRRRRPDGFSAPYAERTWHRVIMSEKLRRLLVGHAAAAASQSGGNGGISGAAAAAQERAAAVTALARRLNTAGEEAAVERRVRSSRSRGDDGEASATASAELLLRDVRLDGRQCAILLKYGGALSKARAARGGQQGDDDDAAPEGEKEEEEDSGRLRPRSLPTKRERRRQQRAAAAVLLQQHDVAPEPLGRDRRQQIEVLERRQQLEGLERWLDGGDDDDDDDDAE